MAKGVKQFLLVEPIAKTPYPPLGLMKIANMLRKQHTGCEVLGIVGTDVPCAVRRPTAVYITSLFTWDLQKVVRCIQFYSDRFPRADIHSGGIAVSLMPGYVKERTGATPHIGLMKNAEKCTPDYSLTFGRRINASITFASRGCPRHCRFCHVAVHEPEFFPRDEWQNDVCGQLPKIIFWDNNWLASPNFSRDCDTIKKLGKVVDFNQGLDARLYDRRVARRLASLRLNPIRFAFDDVESEPYVLRAITLARKHSTAEIRIYVLYNFDDTPEDFYHRISLLNQHGALAFPMEYRGATASLRKFPGPHWDVPLLRAMKLTLIFYYKRGMITESRDAFESIYGRTAHEFVSKLYEIYEYDKKLKRNR